MLDDTSAKYSGSRCCNDISDWITIPQRGSFCYLVQVWCQNVRENGTCYNGVSDNTRSRHLTLRQIGVSIWRNRLLVSLFVFIDLNIGISLSPCNFVDTQRPYYSWWYVKKLSKVSWQSIAAIRLNPEMFATYAISAKKCEMPISVVR
jgi:hypothetical protein